VEWKDGETTGPYVIEGKSGYCYEYEEEYFTFDELFDYWDLNVKGK
jgi:hypothetical protein